MNRITITTINESVKNASYAVRGRIVARAQDLQKAGKTIISCNIGNPHALGQKGISFVRNVLALVLAPHAKIEGPKDIYLRANRYLSSISDIGAYTDSQGILAVRQDVCKFLHERDGFEASPENIFLTNGASEAVRLCMQTIIRSSSSGFKDGVLLPIPQYPLYSALSTLLDAQLVPYYLDESKDWNCSCESLSEALSNANRDRIVTRALVVINPGNPTGQVLDESSIREIIAWARKEQICLMADEVYQENVYKNGAKFVSFRKVALDMQAFVGENPLQLISFHSVSKGFLGECGFRGGYFELLGIPAEVKQEIYKLASISLCSNTIGQITTGLMVQPPQPGDESYEGYIQERNAIMDSLKRRAVRLSTALNELEGVSCNLIDGAMYAFPTIKLPTKAVSSAASSGIEADEMYCLELLEETGIVVVPGSGFKQVEGTHHFRTTILPDEDKIEQVIVKLKDFHSNFLKKYE